MATPRHAPDANKRNPVNVFSVVGNRREHANTKSIPMMSAPKDVPRRARVLSSMCVATLSATLMMTADPIAAATANQHMTDMDRLRLRASRCR